MARAALRIAVVGDIHEDWDVQEDAKALRFLRPDLVLFTGDFGNKENLEIVRSVSNLDMPKAAILGNHDCWKTHRFSKKKKKDDVQLQLECLGEQHVGYGRLDFSSLKLSVVGGRPFSCGGDRLFRPELLSARYGVSDVAQSAKRIHEAASGTPGGNSIIFLAHNGPTGLGSEVNDICGKDWAIEGGDYGDPDLEQAISELKQSTVFCVPLVVFGHMHKELGNGRGLRKMIALGADNTVYLNGAIVPRVRPIDKPGTSSRSLEDDNSFCALELQGTLRAFTVVNIVEGKLHKIAETWVAVCGNKVAVQDELLLYDVGNQQTL